MPTHCKPPPQPDQIWRETVDDGTVDWLITNTWNDGWCLLEWQTSTNPWHRHRTPISTTTNQLLTNPHWQPIY